MRLLTRALVAAAVIALAGGCEGMKDVMAEASALSDRFHEPMNININNGSHLVITLVNAPERELDDAGREGYAREIAAFAKSHWPHPDALTDITVAYSSQSSTGPLTITRGNGSYRWTADELPNVSPDSTRDTGTGSVTRDSSAASARTATRR
ncbi:MAG: hypothetical protein ACJ79K_08345 [Gemmatimonadaceae bacterium]